jgi:hypothetical protein
LPTFFGRLVGIDDQGVRAAARAMIVPSNASDCVWPLAIPDNWKEHSGVASAPPTFVKYDPVAGFPTLAADADEYVPPSPWDAGSGYALPTLLTVKFNWPLTVTLANPAAPLDFTKPTSLGLFVPVQIPRKDGGAFGDNLRSCGNSDEPVTVGDRLSLDAAGTLATALAGAEERIAADPTARWNPTTLRVEASCAAEAAPCATTSPRIVVLPAFDLNSYEDARAQGKPPEIKVVNFVAFFITHVTAGTSIEGQLTVAPGRAVMGKPMVGYWSAFLRTPILAR